MFIRTQKTEQNKIYMKISIYPWMGMGAMTAITRETESHRESAKKRSARVCAVDRGGPRGNEAWIQWSHGH